jgi:hypothetical protein
MGGCRYIMLHYNERNNKIYIITLDHVLADDVYERLSSHPEMESVEINKLGNGHHTITPESILQSARDTLTSKILIFDVRRQTRPILQHAYSEIVRFNRPDFNVYCYSVLIGDGPPNLFEHGNGIEAYRNYLVDLRVDYSPAVFFVDPFLYYSYEEMEDMALYHNNALPEQIPQRLERYFKEGKVSTRAAYSYFRAADAPDNLRQMRKEKRQNWLKSLFIKILHEASPDDADALVNGLSKEGYSLQGESLKINVYPFFFEQWVLDLMSKSKQRRNVAD